MKHSNYIIAVIIILGFQTAGFGQFFFERFDFEVGANRVRNINTKSFLNSYDSELSFGRSYNIQQELYSYTNNYNFSMGVKIVKGHHLRIRRSFNKFGSYITGSINHNSFCGVGGSSNLKYTNMLNLIKSHSIGAIYEYQLSIHEGYFTAALGFEKHWNEYDDTVFYYSGYLKDNFALHSSIGYVIPIYKFIKVHGKCIATKHIENVNELAVESGYSGSYVPLQIGIEVGVRLSLDYK